MIKDTGDVGWTQSSHSMLHMTPHTLPHVLAPHLLHTCSTLSDRFLFQWMANTTASNHTSIPCDPYVNFCPAGMVRGFRGFRAHILAQVHRSCVVAKGHVMADEAALGI